MADAPKANGEEKVSILGIGGRKVAKATGSKKRKTPGEIRIQKDIAEFDGGDVAQIKFPNANDLTKFNVIVTPDTGFWKGATYHFTFTIPAMYPHEPPKVHCDTKIFHPNINLGGQRLPQHPAPGLEAGPRHQRRHLRPIYLFYEPNPDDPLNKEAAQRCRDDIKMFGRHVARTLPRS